MRLPSIDQLTRHAAAAFRRFPYTITAGIVSAIVAISVDDWLEDVLGLLTRSGDGVELLVATTLAIPMFFALRLAQERAVLSRVAANGIRILGVLGLGAFLWYWSGWSPKLQVLHYMQLSLGMHLLASALPYIGRGEERGFWQYNRTLFLRFLTGALYSAVLFAGLAVALVAIDNLFGLDVDEELYFNLWALIAFVFQTWFFTAGVPEDLEALDAVDDYPRGLKLFTQFVLVPLVSVYLVILMAYLAKVLVTTEWPSGWIGWLVSSVSVVGILSILLTYPIRDRAENRWIVSYGRWFWIVMLPAVGMLLAATLKRIGQYGITEPRYILLVLTVWLAGMAVLYGFVRSQSIKWLPITLGILAFATFMGPWGAYSVSHNSQVNRLTDLLDRNGLLDDGVAVRTPNEVPLEDRRQIGAAIVYLMSNHGSGGLVPLLGEELASTDSAGGTDPVREWVVTDRVRLVMNELGMEYVAPFSHYDNPEGYFTLQSDQGLQAVEVAGYDYAIEAGNGTDVSVAGRAMRFELDSLDVVVREDGVERARLPLEAALAGRLASVGEGMQTLPLNEELRIEGQGSGGVRVALVVRWLSGRRQEGVTTVSGVSGVWLFRFEEGGTAATAEGAAPDA
jgi:hypothetical protein